MDKIEFKLNEEAYKLTFLRLLPAFVFPVPSNGASIGRSGPL